MRFSRKAGKMIRSRDVSESGGRLTPGLAVGSAVHKASTQYAEPAGAPGKVRASAPGANPRGGPPCRSVWICRHGCRLDMLDPSWKGEDPPLSPRGIAQARCTGERLRGEGIRAVFSSPFLRTVQTACVIAESLGVEVNVEDGACEWLNPAWFQRPPRLPSPAERKLAYPGINAAYQAQVRPEYPESAGALESRCRQTIRRLMEWAPGAFLVVAHGASMVGMAHGLLGAPCEIGWGYCALVHIVVEGGRPRMVLGGDTSHLR